MSFKKKKKSKLNSLFQAQKILLNYMELPDLSLVDIYQPGFFYFHINETILSLQMRESEWWMSCQDNALLT